MRSDARKKLAAVPTEGADVSTPDYEVLAELEAAATPGPWHTGLGAIVWVDGDGNQFVVAECPVSADGKFIAAARSAVPVLLARVAEQEAALVEAREAVEVNGSEAAIFKALLDEARAQVAAVLALVEKAERAIPPDVPELKDSVLIKPSDLRAVLTDPPMTKEPNDD